MTRKHKVLGIPATVLKMFLWLYSRYPKMKCVIIYSPSCCSKTLLIIFVHWTQKKLLVTFDFHGISFHTVAVNVYQQLFSYQHSSKYLLLCSTEERKLYKFGTTWGWVNDNRSVILGCTIPLIWKPKLKFVMPHNRYLLILTVSPNQFHRFVCGCRRSSK